LLILQIQPLLDSIQPAVKGIQPEIHICEINVQPISSAFRSTSLTAGLSTALRMWRKCCKTILSSVIQIPV
jgi:hypothetical protein